ncbi:hypothetical protein EDC04DRAFT_2609617 [Pisolithus marmoratus]|nr:hypothetical protein EDC04DRAFT_2609617 [Pisolithus marmoratus]
MRKPSPFPNQASPKPTPPSPPKPALPVSNNDDLLAPPEDLDWSTVGGGDVPPMTMSPAQSPVPPQQPPPVRLTQGNSMTSSKAPAIPVNSTKTSPLPANSIKADNSAVVDDELAKHKAHAERFGIPLDPEKLKKWTDHFGSTNMPTQSVKSGSKRAAPIEEVNMEELEQ